jgi:hypothetical protein
MLNNINLCYNNPAKYNKLLLDKMEVKMSEGLIKMYVTLITMGLMFVAVFGSIFARRKLKGIIKNVVLFISFICLILAGLFIILIVFNVPSA